MALVAITFSARSVFGLFLGNENFTFAQFVTEPLFDVPADGHFDVISSIASIDGSQIFVGKMDGTLTVAKIPVLQGVASEPYGLTTLNTLATKSIDQTSVHSNDSVYLVSLIDSEMGTMQVQNVDGAQFSNIDLVPQPLRFFMSPPQQANLFAVTDKDALEWTCPALGLKYQTGRTSPKNPQAQATSTSSPTAGLSGAKL
ncbi:hypothetical protein LTR72_012152 [Exophiala xenobiotica]|nr:hypothetical protein LTR72_012152 [Exophiala xenobiotica]KAK5281940.1 hypothetical protein LTR14_012091 [Exophiala xenobiotica]